MRKIAALILASAASALRRDRIGEHYLRPLVSNAPWWEKVTVTLERRRQARSLPLRNQPQARRGRLRRRVQRRRRWRPRRPSRKGEVTRITFERRFTPGAAPAKAALAAGDTLLGGEMMALAIDPHGAVKDCKVVARSGDDAARI